MRLGWIKSLALPLGLLMLLAACQSGSYARSHAQPAGYAPAYDPCQAGPYGCGSPQGLLSSRLCPPGYRLVRMSYRLHGGSARDCVPAAPRQVYRYAGGPPCGISSGQDCGSGAYERGYREVQRRAAPRRNRGNCCY